MLPIHINSGDLFDEKTSTFIHVNSIDINLEHSLQAISKWESKWLKPFLKDDEKTEEEMLDYIRCMSDKDVTVTVLRNISNDDMIRIQNYIQTKQTATWFSNVDKKGGNSGEQITSELIYYWMIAYNIPSEYDKWHLSRLLTLIEICELKNSPPKKMSREEVFARNRALNEQRKKAMKSKG